MSFLYFIFQNKMQTELAKLFLSSITRQVTDDEIQVYVIQDTPSPCINEIIHL